VANRQKRICNDGQHQDNGQYLRDESSEVQRGTMFRIEPHHLHLLNKIILEVGVGTCVLAQNFAKLAKVLIAVCFYMYLYGQCWKLKVFPPNCP